MATTKSKKTKKRKEQPIVEELDLEGYTSTPDDFDLDDLESKIEDIDSMTIYLKTLLFGEQGTGKTTAAGTHPGKGLFLDFRDKGTKSVRGSGHRTIKIRKWDEVEAAYWYLRTRKHDYSFVCLDTVTNMADIGMVKVMELDGHEGLPIRKHWGQLTQLMKTWLLNFRDLEMHVCFIAQVKRIDEEDLSDEEDKSKVPMMSPAVRAALGAAVDIIGYTYIKEVQNTDRKGRSKPAFEYRMRIGPSSEILTKVRVPKGVKYPSVIKDPTFDKLMSIVGKEIEE